MEPVLEVRHMCKTFQGRDGRAVSAVEDVSFRLDPGEVLGVVGGSGSGKSTVARAIVRLIAPTSGSILVNGREVTRARGDALRRLYQDVQMVFQSPAGSFDPRRTLGDGIGESLRNRGMPRREVTARTRTLLERCGLPAEFAKRYPHEVSGGQCQRAAIARALAAGPKILICDEATSELDVTAQRQILDLLRALRSDSGMSYLFICHNLALVQAFCDRVIVMHAGKIVEAGTPDQIIFSPKSEQARRLVDAALYPT